MTFAVKVDVTPTLQAALPHEFQKSNALSIYFPGEAFPWPAGKSLFRMEYHD